MDRCEACGEKVGEKRQRLCASHADWWRSYYLDRYYWGVNAEHLLGQFIQLAQTGSHRTP